MEFVETSRFTRQIKELLPDDEYRRFQAALAENPDLGPLVRGGGGIRKARVAVGSRGKSAGARIIYYWAVGRSMILMLHAYSKNDVSDLTPGQVQMLAKIVREEFTE
jgi:mRNA-degrading endonuclease RelE of RelBE toxin-antitoxin system